MAIDSQSPHSEIESLFSSIGGEFMVTPNEIKLQLEKLKSFIFDWDGVFNDGTKRDDGGSPFSEVDSMGLNMLRFSYFLKFGFIPAVFIVTGENNKPAINLSRREHFNGVYMKMSNKLLAQQHIKDEYKIKREESAFVFDDILDLGMADSVSLRFYVKRDANQLLNNFVIKHNLAEYCTGNKGQDNAVREVCELAMGLMGNYTKVVDHRVNFSEKYREYLALRNAIETQYFILKDSQITKYSIS